MFKILVFFYSLILFSQDYTITGKVSDSKTNQAIEYVNVFIQNSTFGNTTNSEGKFDIYGLAPGKHTLIASYEGYVTMKKVIDMTEADKSIYVEFKLTELINEDSTVIVEANRIGKLTIKSNAQLLRELKGPPKYLKNNRTSVAKVTQIVFDVAEPIREKTWIDWLEENYVYLIIGATAITIGVAAL